MRIRFKTLKNELFQVELDPSNTVQQLKDAVHSSRPDFPSSSGLRLIYSGTVLDDNERVLSSLNMKEGEFIVCMPGKKPSVTPAVSASSPERPKAATPLVTSSPANTNTNTTTSATTATFPTSAVAAQSPAAAVAINVNSEMLSNLVAMTGFPEALCSQALEAANGDPNLAFEILSGYSAAPPPRRGAQGLGQGHSGSTRAVPTPAPAAVSPLDRLRQHPQFESLKQVIRSNPQALTHVIALINQSDPQLALAINSNPEEFQRIMSEPLVMPPQPPMHEHNFEMAGSADDDDDDGDYGDDEEGEVEMHLDELAAQMGLTRDDLLQRILQSQAGGLDGGAMEELSEEDEVVVGRIVQEYGFQYDDVVEVYFECNRDEHATIQTLFEEAEDGGGEEGEDEFEP